MSPHVEFEYTHHMHLLLPQIYTRIHWPIFSWFRFHAPSFPYLSTFSISVFPVCFLLFWAMMKCKHTTNHLCDMVVFSGTTFCVCFLFNTSNSWEENVTIITETSILTLRIARQSTLKFVPSSCTWAISMHSKAICFCTSPSFCAFLHDSISILCEEKNKTIYTRQRSLLLHYFALWIVYAIVFFHNKTEWKSDKVLQLNWIV